jgi:hypothetical protein
MTDELSSFIDSVYRERYSLIGNNCINKSLMIQARAEELGKRSDLICCISVVKIQRWYNIPTVNPHLYTEIAGEKVDVSLDPGHKDIYCKNSEKKLVMPVNLSGLRRALTGRANAGSFIWKRLKRTHNGY